MVDINGNMQLLGGRASGDDASRAPREPQQQRPQQAQRPAPQQQSQPAPAPAQDYDSFDDDIPF
ncbi:Single-stranded DNA-binding protein [compost metagenome]